MAKKTNATRNPNVPKDFEGQKAGEFFQFKNVGDLFHGVFLGKKLQKSAKYDSDQTVWKCLDRNNGDELMLIGEKTTMRDMLINEGQEFYLEYTGELPSDKGNPYKTFQLYV